MEGHSPTVRIVTLGCAKNEADSARMRELLEEAGFDVLPDPPRGPQGANIAPIDADDLPNAFVVNTCSFIAEATQESIDAILDIAGIRDFSERNCRIVVCGCMPSRYGEELTVELPEVDAFVDVSSESEIAEVLSDLLGLAGGVESAALNTAATSDAAELAQPWAYVKISDGCSRFCAYCTIPRIRGPYASRPASEILSEIDSLDAEGVREVILIGQDTGIWGADLRDRPQAYAPLAAPTLPDLLDRIASDHPDMWVRVMYLQPQGIDDRLLSTMASRPNICPYLDVPLQHCDPDVLHEMNRSGSPGEYLEMISRIREALGECTVRTTFISGFPGETEKQAETLERFLDEADMDFVGVFEYSREDGTPAAARKDQVPHEVVARRAQALRDIADEHGFSRAMSHADKCYDVLVCGVDADEDPFEDASRGPMTWVWGRTMLQAPDVDSTVVFAAPPGSVGDVVKVRITGAVGYDLEGELVNWSAQAASGPNGRRRPTSSP